MTAPVQVPEDIQSEEMPVDEMPVDELDENQPEAVQINTPDDLSSDHSAPTPSVLPVDPWTVGRGAITFTHGATVIEAAEIAEVGRKLHAYVTISQSGKAIYWSDLDLTSASARVAIGKNVPRPVGTTPDFWQKLMDGFCHGVMLKWQEGVRAKRLDGQEWIGESFVVSPMLPKDEPAIIYGDGKSGKGFLTLLLAYATMYPGVKLPGGLVTPTNSGGAVLYLDWESGQKHIQHRLHRIGKALGLPSTGIPFHYQQMGGRSLASAIRSIRADIRAHHVQLVIVDSLAPASMSVGTADGASGAIQFMTALNGLCQDFETAALCIGHVTKKKNKEVFGSVFFKNLARSLWHVTKERDGSVLEVTASHQEVNDGQLEGDIKVTFTFDPTGLIQVNGHGTEVLSVAGALKQVMTDTPPGGVYESLLLKAITQLIPDVDAKVVRKRLRMAVSSAYLTEEKTEFEMRYARGPQFAGWPTREK